MALGVLLSVVASPGALGAVVFSTDFNSGLPAEFSGAANSIVGVQSYAGLGPAGNMFSGDLLHNVSVPPVITTLTLTGLPAHDSLDVEFLMAIIDSWDGTANFPGPDFFNVRVDGNTVFSHTFAIQSGVSDYVPPAGGMLSGGSNLGFSGFNDQAFNMYLEPVLHSIAHTASSVTIDWFASGGGWQGTTDESWGIDNVRITTNLSVPEPASLALSCIGALGSLLGRRRRPHANEFR
jgi:hypothetical protein